MQRDNAVSREPAYTAPHLHGHRQLLTRAGVQRAPLSFTLRAHPLCLAHTEGGCLARQGVLM